MQTYTYPGVYIQEVPSSVHSIAGVATSIGAFVGWAPQGTTTEAVLVQSYMDFERQFGGLDSRSLLGYSVSQFFNNGGQQAYVVRLVQPAITKGSSDATNGEVSIPVGTGATAGSVAFQAASPGAWSTAYGVMISGVSGATFNAAVVYAPYGTPLITLETFTGLSVSAPTPITSNYVTMSTTGTGLTVAPSPGLYVLTGGNDGATAIGVPGATNAAVTINAAGSTTTGITFTAQNPGAWGNLLAISATPQGDPTNTRFAINVVALGSNGNLSVVESFYNLSITPTDPSYVVTVLNSDSNYVTAVAAGKPTAALSMPMPTVNTTTQTYASPPFLSGGYDGAVLDPTLDGVGSNPGLFMNALNVTGADTGIHLLDSVDSFNLLCVPGEAEAVTIANLQEYCYNRRAFYIVDSPMTATVAGLMNTGPVGVDPGSVTGQYSINSAYYYPWVEAPDPLIGNRVRAFPPCGFVAGIYAATDADRGVWKAPAGIDASLTGNSGLEVTLTDLQNGTLNTQAVNCLREFKVYGDVVWGARTLQGNDQAGSQWKYVPIRRLALFLESSLYDGTTWVVFEPNDETLWGQIRLNIISFMQGLFLQGAFQGSTPQQAYFVKCDADNNPQASIDLGIVNILVGFAPLYPAEFVVIQIQQMAGQTQ